MHFQANLVRKQANGGTQTTLSFAGRSETSSRIPKAFSAPHNAKGYNDNSISNDLVTQVYLELSKQTRDAESWAYLRTLTGSLISLPILHDVLLIAVTCVNALGICLSFDHTFKLSKKATVVSSSGQHQQVIRG